LFSAALHRACVLRGSVFRLCCTVRFVVDVSACCLPPGALCAVNAVFGVCLAHSALCLCRALSPISGWFCERDALAGWRLLVFLSTDPEYVAASFVGTAADVRQVRAVLAQNGTALLVVAVHGRFGVPPRVCLILCNAECLGSLRLRLPSRRVLPRRALSLALSNRSFLFDCAVLAFLLFHSLQATATCA
jgi:hypothetical protein